MAEAACRHRLFGLGAAWAHSSLESDGPGLKAVRLELGGKGDQFGVLWDVQVSESVVEEPHSITTDGRWSTLHDPVLGVSAKGR